MFAKKSQNMINIEVKAAGLNTQRRAEYAVHIRSSGRSKWFKQYASFATLL